ncbi:hypothetical protein PIB30_057095 [Stylosanthes scabra]|uniref:Uncharacterized protein n=1 Tax=Stylosanthes scabra TaxID=79078 RepID=A0ABU6VII9_9FABA|nr:hypothetical protein [Stylosanthes scabra]
MLRLEQKWRSQLPTQSGGSKRTKVSAIGAYSSSSNLETPLAEEIGVDSPIRPQGSKKSKRKSKGKAKMAEYLTEKKSSIVKQLSLMQDFRNVREKELIEREKAREDENKHRQNILAIKEKELQMKEQEIQKEMEINAKEREMERMAREREREMDMQILKADTSTMSEDRRALHEIALIYDIEKISNPTPRRWINRDQEAGHDRLFNDYFADEPVYNAEIFRRRF